MNGLTSPKSSFLLKGSAKKKHLKFHEKSMKNQLEIKVQITHKLLKRDQSELKTLEDNSIIFNSKRSAFDEIVAKK
tara:strand:- start:216 stop:443 length:228 start_codon:yes stop_codon:yes gene_type:complete